MEETKFECPHVKSGEETTGFVMDLGDGIDLYLCRECWVGMRIDTAQVLQEAVTDAIDKVLREAMDN